MSEFCRVMRFSMDMRKMNQTQLAQKMGCAKSMVHYWYNDEHSPTIDVAASMANALNRDVKLFYTALEDDMKKALGKEVSISEMLNMRAEGLTNKEIAERLDVHVATIYKYIGKRSMSVRKAEEQNKPCPVNGNVNGYAPIEKASAVVAQIHNESKRALPCATDALAVAAVASPVVSEPVVVVDVKPEIKEPVKATEKAVERTENNASIQNAAKAISSGMFTTIRTRIVTRLQGKSCVYSIDTEAPYVELSDENGGQLAGIIDYEMIPTLIDELKEIYNMRGVC